MLNLFKKKTQGATVVFKIDGMHCSSCSINIDGELEDQPGVIEAKTSYAKAKTTITYDSSQISPKQLKQVIEGLDYQVSEVS
ncbi:cation transporter [Patescibacteria group bacterium]|nr:cation transporter [Patescibacteria group bacterium]